MKKMDKTSVLPLHYSLIFVLFFFALPKSNLAQFLRDEDGDILINGGSYYMLPSFRGKGGGLELAKTGGETCPLTVVQARSETSNGLPVRISTPAGIHYLITPGFPLNFEFQPNDPSACHQKSKLQWKVKSGEVKIASDEELRLFGPFQIHPYRDHYKLVYCGDIESEGKSERCQDLGISVDDENNRHLVVKDGDPLVVRFVKAYRRGSDRDDRMSIVHGF